MNMYRYRSPDDQQAEIFRIHKFATGCRWPSGYIVRCTCLPQATLGCSAHDQSRAETDAPEFHVHMTPPQNGIDVEKEDWAEYEADGGRMQAQNTVHNDKMPVTRKY